MSQRDDSESGYSDQPDQTNPKARHDTNSDDRDGDAEDRSADDSDATIAQSEVEEILEQAEEDLEDETVTLGDIEEFENEDSESGDGESTASAAGGGAAVGDSTEASEPAPEAERSGEESGGPEGLNGEQPDRSDRQLGDGPVDADRPEGEIRSTPSELGPTDPETVQAEFGLDFSDTATETADHSFTNYRILSDEQQAAVRQHIEDEHGEQAWETIKDLTAEWKGKSKGEVAGRMEAIAKEALGVDAPNRTEADDIQIDSPTAEEVAAYRDLSRISQGFLREHYADENGQLSLRRGIPRSRGTATADFTRQLFSDPDRDEVTLETSVLSNHTPVRGTADFFEDVYSVSYKTDVDNIAYMPGLVHNSISEAEMHVAGGGVQLPTEGVGSSQHDRSLNDLSTAIKNPAEGDLESHTTLKDGIRRLQGKDHTVDESTARELIRYGYKADEESGIETRNAVWSVFKKEGKEYEDLYDSYDPVTDTFDD